MNDSDGIARSLPRISPYRGGEPVLQRNTRFSVSWAWCYAPKPSRCHLLHLFSLSRSGEPVLQGNTRFSVLLKAPRHKKMRGSNPYVGALPLCGKNPRVDSCCVFHTCSRSGEPVLQGNTRFLHLLKS